MRDSGLCITHSGEAAARGFGGAQANSGPKPLPKAIEVLRERLENDLDRWLRPFERALDSDDGALAMKAAAEVLDRVYGKPRQAVEMAHSGGVSIEALFAVDPLAATHSELPEDAQ